MTITPIDLHDDQRTATWFATEILASKKNKTLCLQIARWLNDGPDHIVFARTTFFTHGIVLRSRGSLAHEAATALDEEGEEGLDRLLCAAMDTDPLATTKEPTP